MTEVFLVVYFFFLVILHQLLDQQISLFTTFQNVIQPYLKKDFRHEFFLFNGLTQAPSHNPLWTETLLV